ncbi:hypothetical protein R3X27_23695 [Tropicimonas sp. TH_r6]|nr:hypothetical protein [Tropicimonas sp. TH_r6]MDV7145698.1 hypothetical protein [Tropicimonas sp. TH_r6]
MKLPVGMKMHFYVPEKKALYGGWDLFNMLMNPATIATAREQATQTLSGGEMCRNYTLSPAPEWQDTTGSASGIFKAGDRQSTESWIITDPSATWHLSQLLQYVAAADEIFWISCRVQIG